jgi:hypothetical protein
MAMGETVSVMTRRWILEAVAYLAAWLGFIVVFEPELSMGCVVRK